MTPLENVHAFFRARGWQPLDFQEATWQAQLKGKSGLISVPTGSGKTYASTLLPLAEMQSINTKGVKLLYLTPLRAVARDIEKALVDAATSLAPELRIESRTGDTKQSAKRRQLKDMPDVLLTTPESLSILLSYKGSSKLFKSLKTVVVDEWHELLSTKRGTQTELCLAYLRQVTKGLRIWGMSASIANLKEAAQVVSLEKRPALIQSSIRRDICIKSISPSTLSSFPWANHLGSKMLEPLLAELDTKKSTLLFTNTRRQAERWYQLLLKELPEFEDKLALHHSSIERAERERVEAGLKDGSIKWVVATSSLDLGVDFQPVEEVVQIGSPKSVARILQRAGRSAHKPGVSSRLFFVPTSAFELLEIAAVRKALSKGVIEARRPLDKPFDVLAQHLVTVACGDGFGKDIYQSLVTTNAYKTLSEEEFNEVLLFVTQGGKSLKAYPEYQKVDLKDGIYKVTSQKIARRHRMSIGTITSSGSVFLKFTNRQKLGSIDEGFIARLRPGDTFLFGGRSLEFVMMKDMSAFVRRSKKAVRNTPSFGGSILPLSSSVNNFLQGEIHARSPEASAIKPLLDKQSGMSYLPKKDELLLETCSTREGSQLFIYPFAGRGVHEGLGALLALRMAKRQSTTFSFAVNDYGIAFLAPKGYSYKEVLSPDLLSLEQLEDDIAESINLSELAKRQFREVAQIAGLVFAGYPGSRKSSWQLQASASVIFDVLKEYEPDSLLLEQARKEAFETYTYNELLDALAHLNKQTWCWAEIKRPSPMGFPLLVERLRAKLSTETLAERVMRMVEQWAHV